MSVSQAVARRRARLARTDRRGGAGARSPSRIPAPEGSAAAAETIPAGGADSGPRGAESPRPSAEPAPEETRRSRVEPASSRKRPAAARPLELTLEDAIRMGLENNLDVQVERYAPMIAELDVTAAWGAYDPELFAEMHLHATPRLRTASRSLASRQNVNAFDRGVRRPARHPADREHRYSTPVRRRSRDDNSVTRRSRPGTTRVGRSTSRSRCCAT